MDIGIVVPNAAPGVDGRTLVEWGRRAEQCGFAQISVIGRIAYPSHEELVTLGAIAGATERIKLMTSTLLAPLREPVLLAKQAASVDSISGGRLTLGLSAGMREDDFTITGSAHEGRGKRFDRMLEKMHAVWSGERFDGAREASPAPVRGRIPIYFGALSARPRIVRRIVRWGDGFIPVGSPQMVAPIVDAIRKAWDRASPLRLVGAGYFVLGPAEEAERNILDYYGDFYPELGKMAAAAMIRNAEDARRVLDLYRDAGYHEFNFSAAATDPAQVERLAEAVL